MIILRSKHFGLTEEEKRDKKKKGDKRHQRDILGLGASASALGTLGSIGLVAGLRTNQSKNRGKDLVFAHEMNDRGNDLVRLTTKFRNASSSKDNPFDNTGSPTSIREILSSEPKYNRKKGKVEVPTGENTVETLFHNDPESLSLSMAKMMNHNKAGKFKKEALDKYTTGTGRFLNSDTGHTITRAGRGLSLMNSIRSGLHAAKEESKGKKEGKLSKHSSWILPTLTEAANVAREVTNRNTANKLLKDSNVGVSGNYLNSQMSRRLLRSGAVVAGNLALRKAAKLVGRKIYKKQDEDSKD